METLTATDLAIPAAEAERQRVAGTALVVAADRLDVVDAVTFEDAAELRTRARVALGWIAEYVAPRVKRIYDAWKGMKDLENLLAEGPKTADRIAGQKMARYVEAERARAEAAEREERRQREAAEREAREDYQRRVAEAESAAREARAAAAAEAEMLGDQEAAAAIAAAPAAPVVVAPPAVAPLPPPAAVSGPPIVKGTSVRTRWKARVVDFAQLVDGVAKNHALLGLLEVHQGALDALARGQGQGAVIPGCEVYSETTVAQARR